MSENNPTAKRQSARIGDLKSALEQIEETSSARIHEVVAVLRLAQSGMLDGSVGDAVAGISAAQRILTDLEHAMRSVVNEVHPCGPS